MASLREYQAEFSETPLRGPFLVLATQAVLDVSDPTFEIRKVDGRLRRARHQELPHGRRPLEEIAHLIRVGH
jgi:hypothetical protein